MSNYFCFSHLGDLGCDDRFGRRNFPVEPRGVTSVTGVRVRGKDSANVASRLCPRCAVCLGWAHDAGATPSVPRPPARPPAAHFNNVVEPVLIDFKVRFSPFSFPS